MSEESNTQQQGPQFAIQRIYTKDVSFETPNSPAIFTEQWEPEVNVELNSTGNKLADDVFEVILAVTVTAKLGEKTAYLAEVQQAGIFNISGFSEQDMGGMIHSYCPNVLFPYVREVVSDLVTKGSFPQMVLQPINFDALNAQHLEKQQAGSEEKSDAVH